MYSQTEWKDHVVQYPDRRKITDNGDGTSTVEKATGEVIQQGTPQSATNFNNMEDGIQDGQVGEKIFLQHYLQKEREYDERVAGLEAECINEVGTISLTNSQKYPFNNSQKSVALKKARKTLNYDVDVEVTSASGCVGDITITDKQLNGFKIAFEGSAGTVTIKYRVKGGLLV